MENESLDIQKNNEISKEPKKKGNKGLIVFLVLVILAMGGYITYDKVLKDKYFSKDSDKPSEVKTDENNNKEETKETDANEDKKYSVVMGTLETEFENTSKALKVNGKQYYLSYTFIDDGSEAGLSELSYNTHVIYSDSAASPNISNLKYFVFEAKDNKEYILLHSQGLGEHVYLLNENGDVLKEFWAEVEDNNNNISCLVYRKNDSDTITVDNGSVYYYKYDSLESKENYTAKMNKIKLDINNDLISESKTGEQEIMQLGQCSE